MMLQESNPPNAVKEDFSVSYITQLAADAGVAFEEDRKDYIGVDGSVNFVEAPLRIQLKSTTQEDMWAPSIEYYLREEWLRKWRKSRSPIVLVLLVLNNEQTDDGVRLPYIRHSEDDYRINGRGYWARVDDLAKSHDFENSKGLSITLDSTHRIGAQSVIEWHTIAMSMFGEGSAS